MAAEGSNRRPIGRRAERRVGSHVAAGHRTTESPVAGDDGLSTTLMLDGRHYVVTGAKVLDLREALAPYIAAARAV